MSPLQGRNTFCQCQWLRMKANSLVRQHTLSNGWPGEEKPLAARLSGIEVSLSSAIKCPPLSPMNHRVTGETVHCCLKASVPLIHVPPHHPPLLPFAHPGHKPRQCPPLTLLSITMSSYLPLPSHPPLVFLSLSWCLPPPGMTELSWWMTGCSATLTHTGPNLCADGEALIKGINHQNVSIRKRGRKEGALSLWYAQLQHMGEMAPPEWQPVTVAPSCTCSVCWC